MISALPLVFTTSRIASAARSLASVSATTSGRAANPAASTPTTLAARRPVPMRSTSTSRWATGGAPGAAAGRRAQIRFASHGATAPTSTRLPNTASRMAGTMSTPVPTGGSRWRISPSTSVRTTKAGHIHAPRSRQRTRPGQKRSSRFTGAQGSLRSMDELWVAQLGALPYGAAVALQEAVRARRQAGEIPDSLLVLEHPPVYTRGRRTEAADLPMGEEWYRAQGIDVADSDRGGRVTYHGPGQLVAYPIMAIDSVAEFVRDDGGGDGGRAGRRGHRGRGPRGAAHRRLGGRRARSGRSACTCPAASPPTAWR